MLDRVLDACNSTPEERELVARHVNAALCAVLYGSAAIGECTSHSDVDLLCVGDSYKRVKTERIDILWIDAELTNNITWLGSELASHVAKYGTVLKGDASWFPCTYISKDSVVRKERALYSRARSFMRFAHRLSSNRTNDYLMRLRLEAQRFLHLQANTAVPPRPLLIKEWEHNYDVRDNVVRLLLSAVSESYLVRLQGLQ